MPAGSYCRKHSCSGDTKNSATATACYARSGPNAVTQAEWGPATCSTHPALVGGSISDTANLAGGFGTLGGTITFTLYGPNDATCGRSEERRVGKDGRSSWGRTGSKKSD